MTTLSGHRAKYWFGKHVQQAPGTELGKDARGNDGKVSQTKRWFSYDWWFGHNMTRSSAGTWSSFDNRGNAPAPSKWGKPTQLGNARRTTSSAEQLSQDKQGYAAYVAQREDAATSATNGYMVTPAGKAKGYTGGDFFAVDNRYRPGRRWMTDELRAWFGDSDTAQVGKGGGGVLSFTAYTRQTKRDRAAESSKVTMRKAA